MKLTNVGRCATSHKTHNTLFHQHGVFSLEQCCWQQDRARSLMWNNLHDFPRISSCSQLQGYNHCPSSTGGSRPSKGSWFNTKESYTVENHVNISTFALYFLIYSIAKWRMVFTSLLSKCQIQEYKLRERQILKNLVGTSPDRTAKIWDN